MAKNTVLNDRQKAVLECIYKQFSEKQSLLFLKENGFECSPRTYRRDKNIIKKNSLLRLYQLAKVDFGSQHQERIEKLQMLEKEMWANYIKIEDPYKKILAIERIANLQPIISAYIDSTEYVLQKSDRKQDKSISA